MKNIWKKVLSLLVIVVMMVLITTPVYASVWMSPSNQKASIKIGESVTLNNGFFSFGTVWSSSNPDIVSVSNQGVITGFAEGTAVVTAISRSLRNVFYGGIQIHEYTITVSVPETDGIITVKYGDTMQLTVNSHKNSTVVWNTSDKDILTVDENGLVTGIRKGTATVTASVKTVSTHFWLLKLLKKRISTTKVTTFIVNVVQDEVVDEGQYIVAFDSCGGSLIDAQIVNEGELAEVPDDPTMKNMLFAGWFTEKNATEWSSLYTFDIPVDHNITLYALWVDANIDFDDDGLSNDLENEIGTNPNEADSDGDNLTDYYEYINDVTDPLNADSDGDSVSDYDEDNDDDGLKNGEEQTANSYFYKKDSDEDGIDDGDEIHVYFTDPMKTDTDDDGLTDYEEIIIGLNPLMQSTDGEVNDSERQFTQTASEAVMDEELKESDNWLVPQLIGTLSGLIDNQVNMKKDHSLSFNDNHSVLSDVIDIELSCDAAMTLEFSLTERYPGNVNQLSIAYYDNEEQELHLVDSRLSDEHDKLEGEINSSGFYFVLDIDEFLKSIGIDVKANISYDIESDSVEAYGMSLMSGSELGAMQSESTIGRADIVFVVDTTGSMSSAINNVRANINSFAEKMSYEYNVDMNYALIEYRDITVDGVNSTVLHKNLSSVWFTNANAFKDEVSRLIVGGGGDTPETPIDALELARLLDWRKNAARFVVLVTDTYSKNNNTYGNINMDDVIPEYVHDGITVSAITSSRSYYENLIDQTHGLYGDIYSDFSTILLQLADMVGEETHEGGDWIILDDYSVVHLNGTIDDIAAVDSDGDGLKDSEELIGKKSVDISKFIFATLFYDNIPDELYKGKTEVELWKFKSNPTLKDTDFDGLDDLLDNKPRNSKVHAFVIYESRDDEAGLQSQKKLKGNDEGRAEDFRFADKTKDELRQMRYINWSDFWPADEELYLENWKELNFIMSITDKEMRDVGKNMIDHFADGTAEDYHNIILSRRIENHKNTKTYTNAIESVLKDLLVQKSGRLNELKYSRTNRYQSLMVDAMTDENGNVKKEEYFMPNYNNLFNGMGINVDSLYGNRVEVSSFSMSDRHYKIKLHYVMYDVYGLNASDIHKGYGKIDPGIIAGFRAWYILQHWDKYAGQYKPFITFMEFDREIEGDI